MPASRAIQCRAPPSLDGYRQAPRPRHGPEEGGGPAAVLALQKREPTRGKGTLGVRGRGFINQVLRIGSGRV
eukprot:3658219-Pyramimonas_sp.AAC.1